jgi:hypothetical protein
LLNRDDAADRRRGLDIMRETRDDFLRTATPFLVPIADVFIGAEEARNGDRDVGIAVIRQGVDTLRHAGRLGYGVWGATVLVEALLDRRREGDVADADEAIDWLTELAPEQDSAMLDLMLVRLTAMRARAGGDGISYRTWAQRYRADAESLGFEAHIGAARAMAADIARGQISG